MASLSSIASLLDRKCLTHPSVTDPVNLDPVDFFPSPGEILASQVPDEILLVTLLEESTSTILAPISRASFNFQAQNLSFDCSSLGEQDTFIFSQIRLRFLTETRHYKQGQRKCLVRRIRRWNNETNA